MKNTDDYKRKSSCATAKLTFFAVSKDESQRRTLVNLRRMHCMYCRMPRGTS